MKKLSAYLVLGCNGCQQNDFILCNSIKNIILDIETIDDDKYNKIIFFLENACGLFDYKITDHNKVTNSLALMHKTFEIFEEDILIKIQKFMKLHKECGLYLYLILKKDFKNG